MTGSDTAGRSLRSWIIAITVRDNITSWIISHRNRASESLWKQEGTG